MSLNKTFANKIARSIVRLCNLNEHERVTDMKRDEDMIIVTTNQRDIILDADEIAKLSAVIKDWE
ncbi:hypothetical protein MYOV011v1_p0010 [Vibrio phage 6E35.1a]|nr:hypothetical protein MYOV011v1_p0010 [Vibrio phage 6E35.1a]